MLTDDHDTSTGPGLGPPTGWRRLLLSRYALTRSALVVAALVFVHIAGFSIWIAVGVVWTLLPIRLVVIAAAERLRGGRWQWVAFLVALGQLLGLLIWALIGLLGGFLHSPAS